MATIRHRLQKEIFEQNSEKLLSICNVEKLYKKKKQPSFLCIVYNLTNHDISIMLIKQHDKNFKRKNTWKLQELKGLDGKNENPTNLELDLQFEKIFRWITLNPQERKHFIMELWKQCCKFFPKERPVFKNVPEVLLIEDISTPEINDPNDIDLESIDISEDFQAITEKEESDLEKLMSGCEFAISNAEAFMDIIARDLSLLDGENVQCVLASEPQVENLMELMEAAISEAEKIETRLDEYDKILCNVRDSMEKMETKNKIIEMANKNNHKLLVELEKIVVSYIIY